MQAPSDDDDDDDDYDDDDNEDEEPMHKQASTLVSNKQPGSGGLLSQQLAQSAGGSGGMLSKQLAPSASSGGMTSEVCLLELVSHLRILFVSC